MNHKFMKIAIKEAKRGMDNQHGGPFGAVIVKNGKIISKGHNQVLKTNDPTMHAEMVTIRKACKKLGRFDLSDCELYSVCEPCPMCFGAIHWAKIKKAYFGCSAKDAADIGFSDNFIYDVIRGKTKKEYVKMKQMNRKGCLNPFKEWKSKKDRKMY